MYFHRANKIKPAQQICLEGIRKITDILECTICNSNIHLTITNNLNNNNNNKQSRKSFSSPSTTTTTTYRKPSEI